MTQLKDYEIIQTNISGLHYYKKTMETKINTNYCAHVFFTEPMKVVDLNKYWEDITSVVAVRYQSKVGNLIERSNFYIIFYVDGELDDSLCEKIEGDEFCARKYLVQEPYVDEESAIYNINARLFLFASNGIIPQVEKPIQLNKLVLHNFRTYENRRTFDFTCSDAGPSSFILIYAKNGVGKTSIFDGVEFLLKGAVDRINILQKINSKSVTPDTMLHNIKHKNEESTVLAILSDSRELERRVGWNTDNDLRQNVPVKGKDFIYDSGNQRDWQKIILPHDSIDGYTTSNTPERVYRDWINQSNLREESESFIKMNQDCNKIKKVISECGAAISRLDDKLEEMRCNRDAVEEIIRLLALFNTKKRELGFPDGNDMFLSMDADVEAYDLLINSSKSYNRLIESRLSDQIIPEKEKLSVIQKRGKGYYEKKHSEYISLNTQLKELKNKMDLRKKLEEVLENLSSVSNEKNKFNNEIQQIIAIINYGGTNEIWNKADRILELQLKDAGFKDIISKLMGSLDHLVNDLMKVRASIDVLEAKLNDEDKHRDALKVAEQYETINAMVNDLNISLEINQSNLETLERSMKQKNENNKVFLIHLPNKLQEVNIDMVHSCSEFLGLSKVKELFSLVNKYDSIQAEIKLLENQIQKRAKNEDEFATLIQQAITFVAKHPDRCECPICGKAFESNDALYAAILDNNNLQQEVLVENLKKSQAKLVLLEERYQENADTLRAEMDKQIKATEESFAKLKADYEEQKKKIDHLLELKQKGEEKLERRGNLLIQYGEDYKQNPIEVVEQWYAKKRTELNMQEEQLKKLKDEADRTEQELNEKKISREKGQKELEALNSDHKLQQSIEFMNDKSRDWSAAEEMILIKSKIKELEDQYSHLSKEKAKYSAVENLSLDFILGQFKDCENRLKEFLADEEEYSNYFKNDDLYLDKELKKLENEEHRLREEQEILQKILDENRARSFFEEYGKTIIEKKHLSEQFSDLKKEASLKEEEKNRKKIELEDKLKEHFNQTVMKTVFSKIDPHREMKSIEYTIEFSKEDKPQLYITANDANNNKIRPEWYFSTAQMNTLVFSAFFSRALKSDLELKTIFIDDPIAHFDDMNILGFADLIRCLIMDTPFQFIMSTHDRKIYEIMRRKLPSDLYRAKYIEL